LINATVLRSRNKADFRLNVDLVILIRDSGHGRVELISSRFPAVRHTRITALCTDSSGGLPIATFGGESQQGLLEIARVIIRSDTLIVLLLCFVQMLQEVVQISLGERVDVVQVCRVLCNKNALLVVLEPIVFARIQCSVIFARLKTNTDTEENDLESPIQELYQ